MSPDRVTFTDKGTLDEIVASGGAQLEHMGGQRWFLEFVNANGSSVAVNFTSPDLHEVKPEFRAAPAKGESK